MFDFSFDWLQTLSMLGRVALAAVLAGIIGYEREHVQRNAGMRTMYEDGLAKAMRGETTIEEVLRVTEDA